MIANVLVPLDGSDLAEQAVDLAAQIATAGGGELTLFRVVPFFTVLAADPMLYEEMNRMAQDEAISYLRQVREGYSDAVRVEVACDFGSPAEAILQHALDSEIDLIVMSSRGRSGISRWVYGSVAERVLSQSPCPVLIINANLETRPEAPRRILVPLDGSPLAEKALGPARDLSVSLQAHLYLLRVVISSAMIVQSDAQLNAISLVQEQEYDEAHAYLLEQADQLAASGVHYAIKYAQGGVAEAIIDYSAENDIDLIVMSSHGRTGLKRWVYGSVAEKVLRSAFCATLVVRDK